MIDLFGHEVPDAPRKRDATNAERQARFVAQRTELNDLPSCANQDRRTAAEASVVAFGVTYCMRTATCKGLLKRTPSKRIADYAGRLQRSIENGGLLHIRFPRGAGKTTWIKIAILWGLSTGRIKYGVAIAASGPLAAKIIRDIWDICENGDDYAADYPEVSFPIRALEGMFQRAAGQTYNGTRTQIRKTHEEIRLPIIEGAASSGGIIIAKGAGSALRGLVDGSFRPDYVLLDDIQTRKDAMSPTKTENLIAWVQQDILGLGGDTVLPIGMASTPIAPNDFSEQFANGELHPEWETISYPMVISWPDREYLWEEYDKIYRQTRTADSDVDPATEFYRANRDDMDAGGEVLDPECYDPKHELSGMQHARNLLIRANRRDAFNAEYQLVTKRKAQMLTVDARHLATKTNGYERGVLPRGTLEAVAFVDVMADAGLHYSVVAFGPGQTSAIIDYGIFPGDGSRIVPPNAPDPLAKSLLAAAEHELTSRLLRTSYRRADGVKKNVHAVWIDHGWQKEVGVRICELFRSRGFQNCFTCAGRSSMYYDGGGKHVVARGFQVDMREADGVKFAMQNSDFWKEAAQRAFYGTPLAPGSVSLWGNDPEEHRDYCEQVSNEILTDKAISSKGVEIYKWTLKPGANNHFLDTLSGCFAMASWYRFWDSNAIVEGVKASEGVLDMPAQYHVRSSAAARRTRRPRPASVVPA